MLNDGWLPLEPKIFSGDPTTAAKLLDAGFVPKDTIPTSVNEWLVNTGDKLVLVDTGTSDLFGPTLGRLARNLTAAGVSPSAVDAIVLTHMHPDHANGLLTPDRQVAFPNASVHVHETELAFWTSAEIAGRASA